MISVDKWSPADGLALEPNALLAAQERNRSLALTAGPGAGKTEMLAQRADFLLRTDTCTYPKRILAISFKADASKNLKERVVKRCGQELAFRFDSYTFHGFAKRIIDRFRVVLTGSDALKAGYSIGDKKITNEQITFKDLVPLAIKILNESIVAKNAIRQTYSDVFLDEFQDCTTEQYELIKVAFHSTKTRLTAVGDTKQKIMGWAGALDGIFETFANDFDAITLNMYRNFRSKPRLLRLQNEIIKVLDPASEMPDGQMIGEEGEINFVRFNTAQEEADYIVDQIIKWNHIEKIPLSEIAVLVAMQPHLYAQVLMNSLESKSIPYRNEQELQEISVEPAARLVVDYLLCLYGEREPKAWAKLMELLTPFTDEDTSLSVRNDFYSYLKKQRKIIQKRPSDQIYLSWESDVREFINKIGIKTLIALSADYESKTRLHGVLQDTKVRIQELLKRENHLIKALANFSEDQSVRILTMHKSKGLEFDSTIIMAVEEEVFFDEENANRCVFFVGVSRAKRRLLLTSVSEREKPEGANHHWKVNRNTQGEFYSYALPFLNN